MGGKGGMLVKVYKLPVTRLTTSGAIMYKVVIIASNTVYWKISMRVDHESFYNKKKFCNCVKGWILHNHDCGNHFPIDTHIKSLCCVP